MKQTILLTALLAGLAAASAQEIVPREDALKAAFIVSADLKQMLATPISTDPDVKRPVALRQGERGALVLPECKLSAETLAKAGTEVVPVGQLWMRGLNLQDDAAPPKPDKLLSVTVGAGDKTATVLLCALGVRKDADGKLELLIYGKDKEPLQHIALKPISASSSDPIELTGEQQGGGALLTLRLLGKQEASFMVLPD
jgi:hypothetical protein